MMRSHWTLGRLFGVGHIAAVQEDDWQRGEGCGARRKMEEGGGIVLV